MDLGALLAPGPPTFALWAGSAAEARALAGELAGAGADVDVRVVDGSRTRSVGELYDELTAALDLPEHFGRNFDALNDLMNDLSWLPGTGHVVVVTDADLVLSDDPDRFVALADILDGVTAGRDHLLFRWVLQAEDTDGIRTRLAEAGVAVAGPAAS